VKSMLLCDHHMEAKELQEVGKRIQRGEPVEFDDDTVRQWVSQLESDPEELDKLLHPEKYPSSMASRIGCIVIPSLVFLAILVNAGIAIWRFFRG